VSGNGGCPRSAAYISGGQPAVIEDRADEAAALLQRCMELAFADVFPKSPLSGLVKLGRGRAWSLDEDGCQPASKARSQGCG